MILHNYEVNHINTIISTMIFIITVLLALDARWIKPILWLSTNTCIG